MSTSKPSALRVALLAAAEALADHLEAAAAEPHAKHPRRRSAPPVVASEFEQAFAANILKKKGIPVPAKRSSR